MQKRALAVHDLSCVGRCSLTVALPILSAAGVNTAVIPTALLSTHTGEFTGYTHLDLSDQLSPITAHLATLGLHFDAFYSGYLASGAQVEQILSMLDQLCDSETHIFVDPAFADHGRRYSLIDESMPAQMRRLCARANTIVPNLTEAAFLLDLDYASLSGGGREGLELARALSEGGRRSVVLTGVSSGEGMVVAACYDRASGRAGLVMAPRVEGEYHGTGDIFASVLTGGLVGGMELEQAAALAARFVSQCAERTRRQAYPRREGVDFEPLLGWLARERGL